MPLGFRLAGPAVVVNDGPKELALGSFPASAGLSGAGLWTRQALTDQQLRAVVFTADRPDFDAVHTAAEHTASQLGIDAVEVAVCAAGTAPWTTVSHPSGWRLTRIESDPVVLLTDALVAELPDCAAPTVLLVSGASGRTPEPAEFLGALA